MEMAERIEALKRRAHQLRTEAQALVCEAEVVELEVENLTTAVSLFPLTTQSYAHKLSRSV